MSSEEESWKAPDIQIRGALEDTADSFPDVYRGLRGLLLHASNQVDVGEWHAMDVRGNPTLVSHELEAVSTHIIIPDSMQETQLAVKPNLPWAEKQFQERVSGKPLNPGETYKEWPWQSKMDEHVDKVFSHTYMERYWPKFANRKKMANAGIWYPYGDLNSVVDLLARSPFTRQAILPVWFPEDTGAVHGGRVPCSLTYQFLLRDGKLNCSYSIRSCDFVRHFRDDVYMTMRLVQWVLEQLQFRAEPLEPTFATPQEEVWSKVKPGILSMHIGSLHYFTGDRAKLLREVDSEQTKP